MQHIAEQSTRGMALCHDTYAMRGARVSLHAGMGVGEMTALLLSGGDAPSHSSPVA